MDTEYLEYFLFSFCLYVQICLLYKLIVLKRSSRDRDSRKGPRKPYKYWDVPPVGFESMTPMEYKALQGNCA